MKADHLRPRGLVVVAGDGVTDHGPQLVERIGLAEDRFAERPGGVSTLRRFLHQKDDFAHTVTIRETLAPRYTVALRP